jgi:formate C-acetyltransferase
VLTDSVGPAQGRDTRGPTAMLKSVARLPLSLAIGTPVLNVRFQRQFLATPAGLKACVHLIRTFFELGGMQIQISVLSKAEMLAAQADPEKYRDLLVRIGGYSEYFTKLVRALQDSVIARTEHGTPVDSRTREPVTVTNLHLSVATASSRPGRSTRRTAAPPSPSTR